MTLAQFFAAEFGVLVIVAVFVIVNAGYFWRRRK